MKNKQLENVDDKDDENRKMRIAHGWKYYFMRRCVQRSRSGNVSHPILATKTQTINGGNRVGGLLISLFSIE